MKNPFRTNPQHTCKPFLTPGDKVPEGTEQRCPECGTINVRYDYDGDWGEGTATFCGWRSTGVIITDRELELTEQLAQMTLERDHYKKLSRLPLPLRVLVRAPQPSATART